MTLRGHKVGQTDHKGHRDLRVIKKATVTSNAPVTYCGNKLGQTDHKGHRDLWGHKVGHGYL